MFAAAVMCTNLFCCRFHDPRFRRIGSWVFANGENRQRTSALREETEETLALQSWKMEDASCSQPIMDVNIENAYNVAAPKSGDNKNHKKRQYTSRSKIWRYFTKSNNQDKAQCNKCKIEYNASSEYGTGNLWRHLKTCSKQRDVSRQSQGSIKKFREMLIRAIIRHDLPLQFVEYECVRQIFRYLNSDVKFIITRNTAKADILKLHEKEMSRLSVILHGIPGRISLTSDLWTSIATDKYLSLTAHFIDKDWVLQKRILNFSYMPPLHSGSDSEPAEMMAEMIYGLLTKWGIEKKLFSITLDNASLNDVMVDKLKNQLNSIDALVGDGGFFHIRCSAHILNLIVQEGLKVKEIDLVVNKVRESVKYVKGSQARKQKFLESVAYKSLDSKKSLKQDVSTRWNSTYLMLASAVYYCCAFCHLQLEDSNFKHCPSQEEWDKVGKIQMFLKKFYDTTVIFSGSKYPTSNLYFQQVFSIQLTLNKEMQSSDTFIKEMSKQMDKKFKKYWSEYSEILAIAIVFDPRYKLDFVERCYKQLYGEGFLKHFHIRDKLFSLFDEYMSKCCKSVVTSSTQSSTVPCCESILNIQPVLDLKAFAQKSQLQLYLDEPSVDIETKLLVLDYWRAHQYRYPELAILARDVLTIPISTVASESAFSIGGRVLGQYRSALKPHVVEALMCTRDWLCAEKENSQVQSEELGEDVINLTLNKNEEDVSVQCSNVIMDLDC